MIHRTLTTKLFKAFQYHRCYHFIFPFFQGPVARLIYRICNYVPTYIIFQVLVVDIRVWLYLFQIWRKLDFFWPFYGGSLQVSNNTLRTKILLLRVATCRLILYLIYSYTPRAGKVLPLSSSHGWNLNHLPDHVLPIHCFMKSRLKRPKWRSLLMLCVLCTPAF